jgi:hypothetical protein
MQEKDDGSAVTRPFWLILSLRYTTSVLPGYCQDGRPSRRLPFLLDSCGLERNADFQNMPTRWVLISGCERIMISKSA